MPDANVSEYLGWRGADLAPTAGRHELPETAALELINAVAVLAASPLPLAQVKPPQFSLTATRQFVDGFRDDLATGLGFALIDRLPLDVLGEDGCRLAHWLFCSLIERPVAQNWRGNLIYDVTDTGRPPGNGVRPDKTNAEQNFHTDNSYNLCPPNYVALLCLRPAKTGGISHIVSFQTAHDALKTKHPDLLERLYQPFHFDRQREHAPDDVMTTHHPLFDAANGHLLARLSRFQVINGQKLAGADLDRTGLDALDALEAEMNAPGMDLSFFFEPGQIQIVNNRRIGHRRTSFDDWPEDEKKRLLVRLWLRDHGRKFYNG
jgi:alpha-ketoglutarate-dependent taurine dioxygenase